jgi:hypothetical protein
MNIERLKILCFFKVLCKNSFLSGCCIIVLVVLGNVALSKQVSAGVKKAKGDKAVLTCGHPIEYYVFLKFLAKILFS